MVFLLVGCLVGCLVFCLQVFSLVALLVGVWGRVLPFLVTGVVACFGLVLCGLCGLGFGVVYLMHTQPL